MKAFWVLLLSLAMGTAVLAQGAAARPAVIDSQAECTAMQGAWVQRSSWQKACQTSWGRTECLRLGGQWSPMEAAPLGGVCFAPVSESAVAQQCAQTGGNWGPSGSPMPFCQPGTASAKAAPVRKAPDANKLCDSQRDCSYGCVYHGPKVEPGADVMGRCRPTNVVKGCSDLVEKGRLAGQICGG
ncbi:hypothetical protein [Caenimonas sp. SL110]|uniref:hypothetical protein n=1 Tax=Caenimonas sp. SL110 TaxID=1450524 RepID=UPI000653B19A|nr:hypothetical protein [Caenimonas sp. SL110]